MELRAQDIARFRGLADALERAIPDARPITPVVTSNFFGRLLVDNLGGEAIDLLRARVRDIVYVFSVESEGRYFNVCIVFEDSITRAKQNGWYWLGILGRH